MVSKYSVWATNWSYDTRTPATTCDTLKEAMAAGVKYCKTYKAAVVAIRDPKSLKEKRLGVIAGVQINFGPNDLFILEGSKTHKIYIYVTPKGIRKLSP